METSSWPTTSGSLDSALSSSADMDQLRDVVEASADARTIDEERGLKGVAGVYWTSASALLDSMLFSTTNGDQLELITSAQAVPEEFTSPQVEVRYHNLSVSFGRKVPASSTPVQTCRSRASRCWLPFSWSKAAGGTTTEPECLRLSNVSGVLRPGTLTLVLGRPGSGKSALLQALAGRLDPPSDFCSGEVRYNGMAQRHLHEKVLPHCVAYVAQQDCHLAALTVRETLEFARRCCRSTTSRPTPRRDREWRHTSADAVQASESKLDDLIDRQLGLAHCVNSFVGDELRHRVSGGERKRVTVGEMLLGDDQRVVVMDEVSTGLDSATAMDMVVSQRRVAREKRITVAMSLLQPAPELVAQFDELILLADGYLLFHGPVAAAAPHFCALRIVCPLDMPLAEFLLDLGTDRQAQYEAGPVGVDGGDIRAHTPPPRTPSELAAAFRRSPLYAQLMTHLKTPNEYRDEWEMVGCATKAFKQGFWRSTATLLSREIKLVRRNRAFLVGRAFAVIVMALLDGSLFYRVDVLDAQVLMGVLFLATIFVGIGQTSQIPSRFAARQVFAKQRDAHFFRTKSYVVAQAAVQVLTAALEAAVFGGTIYLLCALAPPGTSTAHQAGHMTRFLGLLLLIQTALSTMFSAIAAASPDIQVASTLSMLAVLVFILFGGFLLPVSELPFVVLPLYWLNPIAWVMRGLAVNQYGDRAYRVCQFDGVNYCERYGKHVGEYALSSFGLPANDPAATLVPAVGFLLGFVLVSLIFNGLALERYRHRHIATSVRTKASPSEVTPPKALSKLNRVSPRGSDTMLELTESRQFDPRKLTSDKDEGNRSTSDADVAMDVVSISPDSHHEFALLEEDTARRRLTDRVAEIARKAVRTNALQREPATFTGQDVPPVTVAFRDLSYSVSSGGAAVKSLFSGGTGSTKAYLLRGVSGFAQPRTLTALMGVSGAGKTTLLDVLAGRKTRGCIEGDIFLNGDPVPPKDVSSLRERMGYCEQTDLLCRTATCREAIAFSARLRRNREHPFSLQRSTLDELVDACLRMLGLAGIAHQQVSTMSQEQKKRTAIGVELVAGPSVLLLDEPTSGLDAPASKMVVDAMRHAATAMGCTVICTIHQPSTELFLAFDRVLLLARGGQVAFFGNVARDAGRELVSHFQGIRGVPSFPSHGANPAKWMLDVIGAGIHTDGRDRIDVDEPGTASVYSGTAELRTEHSRAGTFVDFAEAFRESPLGRRLDTQLQREGIGASTADNGTGSSLSQKTPAVGMKREDSLTQLQALLQRLLASYWRARPALVAHIGANLVMSIVLGAVFFDLKFETYVGVNAGVGLVSTSAGLAGIVAFNSALAAAGETRALFYRERAVRMYRTVWYVVAGTLAELPVVAASTLIFTLVEFPMVGLWSSSWVGLWRLAAYWLVLALNTLLQVSMAQLFVFALPTLEVAAIVGALYNALSLTFMGTNPPARAIPGGYRWLHHSVPARYTCALMLSVVFGASDCEDPTGTSGARGGGEEIGCRRLEGDLPPSLVGVATVREMVETMYLVNPGEVYRDLTVALLAFLALRALALLVLERVNHQRS